MLGPDQEEALHPDLMGISMDGFDEDFPIPANRVAESVPLLLDVPAVPASPPQLNPVHSPPQLVRDAPDTQQDMFRDATPVLDNVVPADGFDDSYPSPSYPNAQPRRVVSPTDSVASVSHPNFTPYLNRLFGRDNPHWLNVEPYVPPRAALRFSDEIIKFKLMEGRRVVLNYIIRGYPDDLDCFHKLRNVSRRRRYRQLDRKYFTIADETDIYMYSPCEAIDCPDGYRWETLLHVNNIPIITVLIML